MKTLYPIAGLSKQGYWKRLHRDPGDAIEQEVVAQIASVRKRHKRMSCRKIHAGIENPAVGRDVFERIGFKNGYKLKLKRSFHKTTQSSAASNFPNLIRGKLVTGINQVFQSDIFYQQIAGKHYYGFTILDVYSRRLLALHFANTLRAGELVKALEQAVADRCGASLKGCIFHSDRGKQYIAAKHIAQILHHKLIPSMCVRAQENAYVERVQGILKQEYLDEMNLSPSHLQKIARQVKYLYNHERPHKSLKMRSPIQFEKMLGNKEKNPVMKIFEWDDNYILQQMIKTNAKQN